MSKINCQKPVKNIYILILISFFFALTISVGSVFANSTKTINLQGKIVRNDTGYEGLNVSTGNPPCVVDGAGNDTCDFRVRYYDASSSGTLLLTEEFSDVEIGQYGGAFRLSLGSDGASTAGSYSSLDALVEGEDDIYVEIGFDPSGANSYTETFTRMQLQATAFAMRSKYASEANTAFQFDTATDSSGYSTPSAGMVYFDTTDTTLKVYDGSSWIDIGSGGSSGGSSSGLYVETDTAVPDGGYVEVVHGRNTNDLIAEGWVYNEDTTKWEKVKTSDGYVPSLIESSFKASSATLPGGLNNSQVAVIGDYIYLFGGSGGSGYNNIIYRAPVSNPMSWTDTGSTLPGTLGLSQLAVVGDYVYLFGGYNGSSRTNVIYRAPLSDPTSWTDTGSTLPSNLSNSNVAVIGDYVYLFGGNDGSSVRNIIYRAPVSDPTSWTDTGSVLPGNLANSAFAIIEDNVYLFGGGDASGHVDIVYQASVSDPTSWSDTGSTLPGNLSLSQIVVIGEYIYLLGGSNGSYSNVIYSAPISDPTSWSNTGSTLSGNLGSSQAVVLGDYIYLFGGYNGSYLDTIYQASITSRSSDSVTVTDHHEDIDAHSWKYRPNVSFYEIEQYSSNAVRLYNNSGHTQSLRLNVITSVGDTVGSLWTDDGTYTYMTDTADHFVLGSDSYTPIGTDDYATYIAGLASRSPMSFDMGSERLTLSGDQARSGLTVYSDYNSTGAWPLVTFKAEYSGFDNDVLEIVQDGTGDLMSLKKGSTEVFAFENAMTFFLRPRDTAPTLADNRLYNVGGTLYWNGSAVGSGSALWTDSGDYTYLTDDDDDLIIGGTDGTTSAFYFDVANGRLGIGTDTPTSRIDIAGSTSTMTNATGDITISSEESFVIKAQNAEADNLVEWQDSSGTVLGLINESGYASFGSSTDNDGAILSIGAGTSSAAQINLASSTGVNVSTPSSGDLWWNGSSLYFYDGSSNVDLLESGGGAGLYTGNGSVSSGSYLNVEHGDDTYSVVADGWVCVGGADDEACTGGNWKNVKNFSPMISFRDESDFDTYEEGLLRSKIVPSLGGTNVEIDPGDFDMGDGSDGSVVFSTTTDITATNSISGRTCSDGGDAVNYSVQSLTSNSATLTSTVSAGCLSPGDKVLLINLAGKSSAYSNLGNYEVLEVESVSTNTVTFTTNKTKYYGDSVGSDSNIGTTLYTNQLVMLQRVPQYNNVTVNAGVTIYARDFQTGPRGGVFYFKANGSVTVNGSITMNNRGYYRGTARTSTDLGGNGSYTYNGQGGRGGDGSSGSGSSGQGGGGGGANTASGGSGTIGGAGGGGGGYYGAAGGGGGHATVGGGGGGNPGGASGSGIYGGNGGSGGTTEGNGGGGGGTYGNADLSTLTMGSGGAASGSGGSVGGNGVDGGGIVFIEAESVLVNGSIEADGGNGSATPSKGGSGGGAGGSIKIQGNNLSLGTGIVSASGGTGGNDDYDGGDGGNGYVVTNYVETITGTTSPSATTSQLDYYPYAIYTSREIATPEAYDYGKLRWLNSVTSNNSIMLQTRSGDTADSTDGSWSSWGPSVDGVNVESLENANDHTLWSGTNVTVSDGDITRNVDFFEDEDESTAGNITKMVSSTDGGYAESTISSIDISNYETISFWVRASQTGTVLKLGIGEASATENEEFISIDSANTWQKVYWNISDIDSGGRNSITKIRLTNLTSSSNTIYLDNISADKYLLDSGGEDIVSNPAEYIQIRAIFSTADVEENPRLHSAQIEWGSGYEIVIYDNNNVRLYNYTDSSKYLKLDVGTAVGAGGGGVGLENGLLTSDVVNGEDAVAFTFNTPGEYTHATSKLLSVMNNGTEKMYLDADGNLYVSGTITSGEGFGSGLVNNSGGTLAERTLVVTDPSMNNAITTTDVPSSMGAFGVVMGVEVNSDADKDGECDDGESCIVSFEGVVDVDITNAATASLGDYIYSSTTLGQGIASSEHDENGMVGIVTSTENSASGYVEMVFNAQNKVTADMYLNVGFDKNAYRDMYTQLARAYESMTLAERRGVLENNISEAITFDSMSDGLRLDSENSDVGLDTYSQKMGLWGGLSLTDSTTDISGNRYFGVSGATLLETSSNYYDRTKNTGEFRMRGKAMGISTEGYIHFDSEQYNSSVIVTPPVSGNAGKRSVLGYAWSDDMGWIQFSGGSDYGVYILNNSGKFTGKAYVPLTDSYLDFDENESYVSINLDNGMLYGNLWSDDIGWITFDGQSARLDPNAGYTLDPNVDPYWYKGVSLTSDTENLSLDYNGSLLDVSGTYATSSEHGSIAVTVDSTTTSALVADITSSDGTCSVTGATLTFGKEYTFNAGSCSGSSITINPARAEYVAGDVFNISSWYLEPETSDDRGSRREFPERALILSTKTASNIYISIVDYDTQKVWMKFSSDTATLTDSNVLLDNVEHDITSVYMVDGYLYLSFEDETSEANRLVVDFARDSSFAYDDEYIYKYDGNLGDRDGGSGYVFHKFEDGFETGDITKWDDSTVDSYSTLDVQDSVYKSGEYAMEIALTGDASAQHANVQENIPTAIDSYYTKFNIYIPSDYTGPPDDWDFFRLLTVSDTAWDWRAALDLRGSGALGVRIYDSSGSETQYNDTLELSLGDWHEIILYQEIDSTNGSFKLFLDGEERLTDTSIDTGSANAEHFYLGPTYANCEVNDSIYFDDVSIYSSDINTPYHYGDLGYSSNIGYDYEVFSSSEILGIDSNGEDTTATYYSLPVSFQSSSNKAYLWMNAYIDSEDSSSDITVSVSNDGGSNYVEGNLIRSTGTHIKEYEYSFDFDTQDNEYIVKIELERGVGKKSSVFVKDWGLAHMDITSSEVNGVFSTQEDSVASGDYIELLHAQGTYDLLAKGWVFDTELSKWVEASNVDTTVKHNLSNQWDEADEDGIIRTQTRLTDVELAPGIDVGTGADGSITVSGNTDINTTNLISGRSCSDGGDAVNYNITAFNAGGTEATLSTTPSTGCLSVGDEVLIINLQGTSTAYDNLGNYETLEISNISGNTITFKTAKIKYYGNNATDDSNLGTATGTQRVMLQRVPNYEDVTVNASMNFYPSAWDGAKGGVMFFRASGDVNVNGTIHADGKGYRGGGRTYYGVGQLGYQGESYVGGYNTTRSRSNNFGGGGGGYGVSNGENGGGGGAFMTDGTNGTSVVTTNPGLGGDEYSLLLDEDSLLFGSGGGAGSHDEDASDGYGGAGGSGGGIVGINARNLVVSGSVSSDGSNGENPNTGSGNETGAGGGGGAGSIEFRGLSVSIGVNLVDVDGGSGGVAPSTVGGDGGDGNINILYTDSYSGSTSPTPSTTEVGYNSYGIYNSPAIPTLYAQSFGDIRWEEYLDTYGKVGIQTRSGSSSDPTDGTWEEWKTSSEELVLNSCDDHTTLTDINSTVSEGDITRNVDFFEDEDESVVGNLAKVDTSTNGGYVEATISATDFNEYDYLTAWVRSSQSGNTLKIGAGESAGDELDEEITVDASNTWQKIYWDLSDITSTDMDAITKVRLTNQAADSTSTTIYLDNIKLEKMCDDPRGCSIESSADDYIQYRVIFTTTNLSYQPRLNNIQLTYKKGFEIVQVDANRVRLYNNSGVTQKMKLDAVLGTSAIDLQSSAYSLNLAPTAAQIDYADSTNSIWVNKTGTGGNLLKLQTAGSDTFTVDANGDAVMAGDMDIQGGTLNLGDNGSVRYNDVTAALEFTSDGSEWVGLGSLYKTIVHSAEYSGAVLSADGTDNSGAMVSDSDSGSNSMNYYEWNSSETSLNDYDVRVRFTLPSDFNDWGSSGGITFNYATESTSSTTNKLDFYVYEESSASIDGSSEDSVSSVAGEWTTATISGSTLTECNAGDTVCMLVIKMSSSNDNYVRVGDIQIDYERDL